MEILLGLVGLVVVVVGADLLVRGASGLAIRAGVSSLVIGLTIVAYGTSAPELAISLNGALAGNSGVAVGNVVGSNIFNVLFILGACALAAPLVVNQQLLRVDVPLLIVISLCGWLMALDGYIVWWEGAMFLVMQVLLTIFTVWFGQQEPSEEVKEEYDNEYSQDRGNLLSLIALTVVGLVLLVVGARLFVDGAVSIAQQLGVSDLVIGLTIVAAGTSLPEVATSIQATIRGERDIAVGNVIGSNLFNLLTVLGGSAVIAQDGLVAPANAIEVDFPVMVGVALITLPILFTGYTIHRWEGAALMAGYVVYTAWLILDASGSAYTNSFGWFAVCFACVLGTAVAVDAIKSLTEGRRPDNAA